MNQEQEELYHEFHKNARKAGFTPEQAEFMWENIMQTMVSMAKMQGKF